MTTLTYQDAGVDITFADQNIRNLPSSRSHSQNVISSPNDFAALFSLKDLRKKFDEPVLVTSTDGVGTKVLAAIECEAYEGLGQDLVAMCANDILTKGAHPLFFLDYFASSNLKNVPFSKLIHSMVIACDEINCALVGGETAEMPSMYENKHFDLAGFIVGIAERSQLLGSHLVEEGDCIIGIGSSGLHSNGYSLVRKIMFEKLKHKANDVLWQNEKYISTVADELLRPTTLYHKCIMALKDCGVNLHALAHITGGGLFGNVSRVIPHGLCAQLDLSSHKVPPIFSYLQNNGPVDQSEMLRTFNMGIGMVAIINKKHKNLALDTIKEYNINCIEIGKITLSKEDKRCTIKM
ncbi:MAG: phosphoribosylformylglycinamidine cyclo-ligase [Myxococcales bacterium]|nr:phosphoribosylformylglycinamidine cyclo-ligase [Myxococcales bacterium]USN50142.1 MAG: phosphoribosylformylglycinamidine cyclo-ligase [Myxococcales bacterium]